MTVQARRVDLERRLRKPRPAGAPQRLATRVVQPGDVGAGGSDPQGVGRPPLVERIEPDRHGEASRTDVAEPGSGEQPGQVAFAHPGQSTLVGGLGVDVADRAPERRQGASFAGVVPHAGSDQPSRTGHPGHLGQAGDRVAHEVHDQLGDREVVGAVRERKVLRRAFVHLDPRDAVSRGFDERRRGIDGHDGGRAETLRELCGEHPRAAPHVEGALSRPQVEELDEPGREGLGVDAHEAGVRSGRDVEAHPARVSAMMTT